MQKILLGEYSNTNHKCFIQVFYAVVEKSTVLTKR